jgi:hypothetical protein
MLYAIEIAPPHILSLQEIAYGNRRDLRHRTSAFVIKYRFEDSLNAARTVTAVVLADWYAFHSAVRRL